jgi:hypothetical protein
MTPTPTPSPLTATQLVDEYFIENRNRLIEIAAFLDRLDRSDPGVASRDFRMRAFASALGVLATASPTRVADIQLLLSDPRTEPLPALDRKGAVGAYDAGGSGVRP